MEGQSSSPAVTTMATSRINSKRFQDYIIVWVDANSNADNADTKNTKKQLEKFVNEVQLTTDLDESIKILNEFNGTQSFVITSGAFGQNLVRQIHAIKNLEAIFIFCNNKSYHEGWSKEWTKVQQVETKIEPICQALAILVKQVKNDEIAMSFIQTDDIGSATNLNELDPSFMYTGLLKDTLLTTEFTPNHKNKMVQYFTEKYQNDNKEFPILREFGKDYQSTKAIWWYTRESFLYNDVNRSLRDLEGHIIIDMGFFIHDLHKQIEQLYKQQLPSLGDKKFIVYRGQALSTEVFQKFQKSRGGLLGFNCFLSTSKNQQVSIDFAHRGSRKSGCAGILFVMTIDPSLQMVPFANIEKQSYFEAEGEILFAMHTIFKIGEVEPLPEHANIFQISLELTSEDDPRLQGLKKYMTEQYGDHGGNKLGRILLDMGQYDKAEEIYLDLLETTSNERDIGLWNHCLGLIKDGQGKYQEAIKYYEKAMKIKKRILPENDPSIAATYHCIGLVYMRIGEYSKALLNYEQALEISKKSLPKDHPDLAQSYNNIGGVYKNMGEYSKALEYYEQALAIWKKSLPKDHPDIATSYNNIGGLYENIGEYSKALLNYEQALEMKQKSLPKDHPDIASTYNNLGLLHMKLREYSKALEYYEKDLEISKKSLPNDHPALATSYNNIGGVYKNMGEYSKALEYYEKDLEISKKSLPNDHPDIATSYNNIGSVYDSMGEYSKALLNYEQALEMKQKSLPKDHPDFAQSYLNIGCVYYLEKQYPKALEYLEEARRIYMKSLPPTHPDITSVNDNIAVVKKAMKSSSFE